MNTEQIIEGNILIADFMGFQRTEKGSGEVTYKGKGRGVVIWASTLEFHSSWDWLMPVVEKIEDTKADEHYYFKFDMINRNEVEITYEDNSVFFIDSFKTKNKKEAVWLAVVEFIKWYNKQVK